MATPLIYLGRGTTARNTVRLFSNELLVGLRSDSEDFWPSLCCGMQHKLSGGGDCVCDVGVGGQHPTSTPAPISRSTTLHLSLIADLRATLRRPAAEAKETSGEERRNITQ